MAAVVLMVSMVPFSSALAAERPAVSDQIGAIGAVTSTTDTQTENIKYGENLKITGAGNEPGGIYLRWQPEDSADGYLICRRNAGNDETWEKLAVIGSGGTCYYVDKDSLTSGVTYVYDIRPFYTDSAPTDTELKHQETRAVMRMEAPASVKETMKPWTRTIVRRVRVKKTVTKKYRTKKGKIKKKKTYVYVWKKKKIILKYNDIDVNWTAVSGASKYKVQYCSSRYFRGKVYTVEGNMTSLHISGWPGEKACYIRVRAKSSGGISRWAYSTEMSRDITSTVSYVLNSKKNAFLDLRKDAGQKMHGYDTIQGACIRKNILYTILWKKSGSKKYAKIVTWDLDTRKKKAVSAPLPLYHGNSMTFDTGTDTLVIACCDTKADTLVKVDASTLKIKGSVRIKLSDSIYGITDKILDKYKGISAVTYNKSRNMYAAKLKNQDVILVLDSSFKPVRCFSIDIPDGHVGQSMFCTDDSVTLLMSNSNILVNYDWYGNYISSISLKKGCELESAGFYDGKLFGIAYQSYRSNNRFMRAGWAYRIDRT